MRNLHIIPGISGSGKTSVAQFMENNIEGASRVVPYTTRHPRQFERDGIDYKFRSLDEFNERMANNTDGDWTFSKVNGNFYYNSTLDTLPSVDKPIRILPVSYKALEHVINDYSTLVNQLGGIVSVIPIVISGDIRKEWIDVTQHLREDRSLDKELAEQDSYLSECKVKFDEIFYPTWDKNLDFIAYSSLYKNIINKKSRVIL